MSTKPYIIGITGGSASGKTSILQELRDRFSAHELCVISQDNYYHPIEKQPVDHNGQTNFDLPVCIDRERFYQDIHTLMRGESVYKKEYTFNNPAKTPELIELKPAPVILIEGLFVFYYEEIADLCDLRVFVEADEEVMLKRRLHRDFHERGYSEESIRYQWQEHVMPAYRLYLAPMRSNSDIIIVNNHHYRRGLDVLLNHLRTVIA